jgi:HSP20 family molecular chaperone IbpA
MKNRVPPIYTTEYNEENESYDVTIRLEGVNKEEIDLRVLGDGFTLRAPKDGEEDTEYVGSYAFCCPVNEEGVSATFEDDLLKATFPLKQAVDAKRVKIH